MNFCEEFLYIGTTHDKSFALIINYSKIMLSFSMVNYSNSTFQLNT